MNLGTPDSVALLACTATKTLQLPIRRKEAHGGFAFFPRRNHLQSCFLQLH